jgi:hypothetical protein
MQQKQNSKNMAKFTVKYIFTSGPGNSVRIATSYGLDGPGIESRWEARISAPVQTGPGPTQPPVKWVPGLSRG